MTWQLSVTGLLIGMLVGLTGMGGGSLMTPILILVFGFKPTLAVGTDILHGAVFKSFGAVRHRRLGAVHARITFWMLLGSAPFASGSPPSSRRAASGCSRCRGTRSLCVARRSGVLAVMAELRRLNARALNSPL